MCPVQNTANAESQGPRALALAAFDLDLADERNRIAYEDAFDAWDCGADDERALAAEWDATCTPLREARSAFFKLAREREARRPVPRLPKDNSEARGVVTTALIEARRAATRSDGLLADAMSSYRQRAEAAAYMERAEQIAMTLCERFNARVTKQAERAETAQARIFNRDILSASLAIPECDTTLPPLFAKGPRS